MENLEIRIKEAKDGYQKFREKDFREYQEEAIRYCIESKKKVVVACLPTGAGKSLIGTVVSRVSGGGTYLVHSRALQMQLQGDFPELPILWGRSNYRCIRSGGRLSCAECTHTKEYPCSFRASRCEYVVAKRLALGSDVRILNYDYWITETNYVGMFSNKDGLVIVDEADALGDVMDGFINLEFSAGLMRYLKIYPPKYKTTVSEKSLDNWREWAQKALYSVGRMETALRGEINDPESNLEVLRRLERLSGIRRKLGMFIESVDDTWIYDEREYNRRRSIEFKPRWITMELAERYVWRHGGKFVLMSATFPPIPVMARRLGIRVSDIGYREFPSTFVPEHRPVILRPVANMVYGSMEVESRKGVEEVERILEEHKEEKGLVHTVSYKVNSLVMALGNPRLITHSGKNKIEVLEEFKKSKEPLVFVSPSSERGISLDDDMCRFIIWLKCPYLSLADKLVKARIFRSVIGNLWYKSDALMTIVQGCGRQIRSKDDYGVTYIIDAQIVKLITENPMMVPMWFREAL